MTPEHHYARLRRRFPEAVTYDEEERTFYVTTYSGLRDAFAAARPSTISALHLDEDAYAMHRRPALQTFNALFSAMAKIPRVDWPRHRPSDAAISRERAALAALLREPVSGQGIDLADRWIRPAVSRLLHEMIFADVAEIGPWGPDLFEAAHRIVEFLDGKFRTEIAMLDGLEIASRVLDDRAASTCLERERLLAKFAIFATGHETPANVLCNIIVHGGKARQDARRGSLLAEGLRFDPPIQCLFRIASARFSTASVEIPEGARLGLHLGLASRDSTTFAKPETFDPIVNGAAQSNLFFGNFSGGCPGRNIAFAIADALLSVVDSELGRHECRHVKWLTTTDVRGVSKLIVSPRDTRQLVESM